MCFALRNALTDCASRTSGMGSIGFHPHGDPHAEGDKCPRSEGTGCKFTMTMIGVCVSQECRSREGALVGGLSFTIERRCEKKSLHPKVYFRLVFFDF